MGQHAGLRRDPEPLDEFVQHAPQRHERGQPVPRRVDADYGIAAPVEQAVEHGGRDPLRIVGGVVRLQPDPESPGQPDGVAKAGGHAGLLRHDDQVLVAHQLADRGRHLRCDARSEGREHVRRGFVGEQPVAEIAHCQVGYRGEGGPVMGIEDEAGDLVLVIGDHGLVQEPAEREVGQRHARGDAFLGRRGGEAGQGIARAQWGGLGQQVLQVGESPGDAADGVCVAHRSSALRRV